MKNKKIIIPIVILLIAAAAVCAVLFARRGGTDASAVGTSPVSGTTSVSDTEGAGEIDLTLTFSNGMKIERLGAYKGPFVEDGSDETVDGAAAVTLYNGGTDCIQYMTFSVVTDGGTRYEFELTTLLPGERMMVLEKNKAEYSEGEKTVTAEVGDYAVFGDAPSLCGDVLEITGKDRTVTVKNLSDEAVTSGRVFYKNEKDGVLIGGITYTMSFASLAPGEEISLPSSHFDGENSRIVFVTYAEQ